MTTLEILRTGPLAIVQDLGRVGLAHLGVGRSGAADRRSHKLANRLVANPDDRATIEVTFGGFSRPSPRRRRRHRGDGRRHRSRRSTESSSAPTAFITSATGQVISLGTPRAGLRTYLAVRGGICVQPVLGSRSYDVMSAIGPSPLQAGDQLPVGRAHRRLPRTRPGSGGGHHRAGGRAVRWYPGHATTGSSIPTPWSHTDWVASDRSDRVGMRLLGRPLQYRFPDRQLPSEGATRGAIQVPPNGLPVILGPDHPGDRWLPGHRRGDRRGHRQARPGAGRPAGAAALGAAPGCGPHLVVRAARRGLVDRDCANPGTHRPPGPHRRSRQRRLCSVSTRWSAKRSPVPSPSRTGSTRWAVCTHWSGGTARSSRMRPSSSGDCSIGISRCAADTSKASRYGRTAEARAWCTHCWTASSR